MSIESDTERLILASSPCSAFVTQNVASELRDLLGGYAA